MAKIFGNVSRKGKPEAPIELAEEVMGRLPVCISSGDVAVMGDLGFLDAALMKCGPERITFILCGQGERDDVQRRRAEMDEVRVVSHNEPILKGMKFDFVVGNPPYNPPVKVGGGMGSGGSIWHKFVELAFSLCKENGFVALVHPPMWRLGKSAKFRKASELIRSSRIVWAKLGQQKLFEGVEAVADVYVVQNCKPTGPSTVEFLDGTTETTLVGRDDIPHLGSPLFESICKKVLGPVDPDFFPRKAWGVPGRKEGKFPCVHGGNLRFLEEEHVHQRSPKIYTTSNNRPQAAFDDGKLGIGDHIHYLLVSGEKQGRSMVTLWNSKLVACLTKAYEHHTVAYSTFVLARLPKVDAELSSDGDVYRHFHLTSEEIAYVEERTK